MARADGSRIEHVDKSAVPLSFLFLFFTRTTENYFKRKRKVWTVTSRRPLSFSSGLTRTASRPATI